MSARGMMQSVLATQLAEAIAKDAAKGQIGLVAKEFGPAVRNWLKEVADAAVTATQEAAGGRDNARTLAEGIAAAAQKAGVYNGQAALSGPHLLMLLDNMAAATLPRGKAHADLQSLLEHHYQRALATTSPLAPEHVMRWWFSLGYRAATQESPDVYHDGDELSAAHEALEQARCLAQAVQQACEADAPGAAARKALQLQAARVQQAVQTAAQAKAAALAKLGPWRAATEDDVSRLQGKTVLTPAGERRVAWVNTEGVVLMTDDSTFLLSQVQVRGSHVIDLHERCWKQVLEAAGRSTWMPPEYVMNDWLLDVCRWLEHGPREDIESLVEEVAKEWDGCLYDAPGGDIDVGEAIRRVVQKRLQPQEASAMPSLELRELEAADVREGAKVRTPRGSEVEIWNISADQGVRCSDGQWYCASQLRVATGLPAPQKPTRATERQS
ncbi:hypothetical protein [Ramlibacter sp. AN1133]|uniref:hypothetical protein n=1 Tax=Ramlibacter sp. AN1133 TaxID=3133429 RepID=UPI0030BEFA8E